MLVSLVPICLRRGWEREASVSCWLLCQSPTNVSHCVAGYQVGSLLWDQSSHIHSGVWSPLCFLLPEPVYLWHLLTLGPLVDALRFVIFLDSSSHPVFVDKYVLGLYGMCMSDHHAMARGRWTCLGSSGRKWMVTFNLGPIFHLKRV